jgi:fatty-acyl-CoA synthase
MQNLPGLMMDYQLTLTPIMKRANQLFPNKEIRTKFGETVHTQTYRDFYRRCGQLANALENLGIQPGDRIGTMAWNTFRHHEIYFATPCMGAVCHTLNLRLPADQLTYIINHAEDQIIFVDVELLPLLEPIADQLTSVKHYVVMTNTDIPDTTLPNCLNYEELLSDAAPDYNWPELDENSAAAMCYTSGTTGHPKGVLYSHRALYIHTLAECMTDTFQLTESDVIMPVVPMFHAMAWGLVYSATMIGATLVFPGAHMQPSDLAGLIEGQKITLAAGVPTLWLGLLQELEKKSYDISSLRAMPVGGSAAPRSMIKAYQEKFDVEIIHAWGMTEMSPIGTVSQLRSHMQAWDDDKKYDVRAKQGTPPPGVEIRGIDGDGKDIPWDGIAVGELQARGPWVVKDYYHDERSEEAFMDGWFRTGDVVTIDSEGYINIVDRTKDLVKSGGEWISTVELENAIMAHEHVIEAAVFAVPHPKWQERPLAVAVANGEADLQKLTQEIYDLLAKDFSKWQFPDKIEFVSEIAKTSVGKFDKKVLRVQFKDYQL